MVPFSFPSSPFPELSLIPLAHSHAGVAYLRWTSKGTPENFLVAEEVVPDGYFYLIAVLAKTDAKFSIVFRFNQVQMRGTPLAEDAMQQNSSEMLFVLLRSVHPAMGEREQRESLRGGSLSHAFPCACTTNKYHLASILNFWPHR